MATQLRITLNFRPDTTGGSGEGTMCSVFWDGAGRPRHLGSIVWLGEKSWLGVWIPQSCENGCLSKTGCKSKGPCTRRLIERFDTQQEAVAYVGRCEGLAAPYTFTIPANFGYDDGWFERIKRKHQNVGKTAAAKVAEEEPEPEAPTPAREPREISVRKSRPREKQATVEEMLAKAKDVVTEEFNRGE